MSNQNNEIMILTDRTNTDNALQSTSINNASPKNQKNQRLFNIKTQDIICFNKSSIDFGECIPGTIHESELILTLPFPIEPFILNLRIACLNTELNDLPQYVFGMRRGNSNQFVDEFRAKIQEKVPIKITIGCKTPSTRINKVYGCLIVEIVGLKITPVMIKIEQTIKIPRLQCIKELMYEQNNRIIKLMIKKKSKKEGKIPLKNYENTRYIIETEILGVKNDSSVQSNPKTLVVSPKSQFYVILHVRFTQQLKKQMQNSKGLYKIRKILVLKIKQSNLLYHFPIQISLYDGQKNEAQ